MLRMIIVDAAEAVARPKFERRAYDFDRDLGGRAKRVELSAIREALSAKDCALTHIRSEELEVPRQLRELEEARKSQVLDYQRKLDGEKKRIQDAAQVNAD
jgi:hypothetical protein